VVINDQVRRLFYLYNSTGTIASTFGGWAPPRHGPRRQDAVHHRQRLTGAGHTDTLYVYNANTGWTTYDLSSSGGASNLAVTIPGVGAYLSGNPTWRTPGANRYHRRLRHMHFYPR